MELKQQQSASSSSVYSRLSLPKERIRLRNQFSISIPRVFPLTVSLCSLDFLFRRTNTMIEIITTRFHEAYTWILPPEQHVSHGSFTKEQQRMFSKYKQMNGNSHKTPLLDGDKSIHVIKIWFLSPLCHFPFCLLASLHLYSRSGVEQTHYCGNGRQAKLAQINFHSSLNSLSVFRNFLP